MEAYRKNGGYSFVYVLNKADFESLKKDLESGKNAIKSIEKYTPVTELKVGEPYYAVGYTIASANAPVRFEKDSGFYLSDAKDGQMYPAKVISSCGFISIGKADPEVDNFGETTANNMYYSVMMPENNTAKKVEICTYLHLHRTKT